MRKLKYVPSVTFRVTAQEVGKPAAGADYFNVFVWKTIDDLRGATKLPGISGVFRSFDIFRFDSEDKQVRLPHFGEMHLYEDGFRVGIISHEAMHAAFSWGRRQQLDNLDFKSDEFLIPQDSTEERLCWIQGNFVAQVVSKYCELQDKVQKRKFRMIT